MGLRGELLRRKKSIGLFGLGFIGFSTAAWFAHEGCNVVGYDPNEETVGKVNAHELPVFGLEKWLPGLDTKFKNIKATTNWEELEFCNPLFVAVPTEKDTKPWFNPLEDVIDKINRFDEPKIVIIESTLAPGVSDKVILRKLDERHSLIVAPRRDWFIDASKNLQNLPRIVGGANEESTSMAISVLGIVCKHLLPCNLQEAELVKAVENSYRCIDITLANQLMNAYPHVNIRKVLRLVGSKWNIGTYTPGLKISGYCIPLAPRYLLSGAERDHELGLLKEAVEYGEYHTSRVLSKLINKYKPKKVGLLGLSYKGNIKVSVLSPTIDIARDLQTRKIDYAINDPLYTKEEIERIVPGSKVFSYPGDVQDFDMLIVVADHDLYRQNHPSYKGIIVDGAGVWEKWRDTFFEYILLGEPF